MGNIFDTLKRDAFDVVTQTMGYDAEWTDSVSGIIYKARVGYKDPSEKERLAGLDDWMPDSPYMEYRIDFFTGLKSAVDNGRAEFINITDIGYFAVRSVETKSDGDTYSARLEATIEP